MGPSTSSLWCVCCQACKSSIHRVFQPHFCAQLSCQAVSDANGSRSSNMTKPPPWRLQSAQKQQAKLLFVENVLVGKAYLPDFECLLHCTPASVSVLKHLVLTSLWYTALKHSNVITLLLKEVQDMTSCRCDTMKAYLAPRHLTAGNRQRCTSTVFVTNQKG